MTDAEKIAYLTNTLERIAIAYPEVAGPPFDCPPPPHACDKCEIFFLLAEFEEWKAKKWNP